MNVEFRNNSITRMIRDEKKERSEAGRENQLDIYIMFCAFRLDYCLFCSIIICINIFYSNM